MNIKKITITILVLISINLQASFFDTIKEKASSAWEKSKEVAHDIKESNTTKSITLKTKEVYSNTKEYLKKDNNQSILDKSKEVGSDAYNFVNKKYKEVTK